MKNFNEDENYRRTDAGHVSHVLFPGRPRLGQIANALKTTVDVYCGDSQQAPNAKDHLKCG